MHGTIDRISARLRIDGRLPGYLLGLGRFVGVLLDVGRHLLQGRGEFFHRGSLLVGAGGDFVSRRRELFAACRDVPSRAQCVPYDDAKLVSHG